MTIYLDLDGTILEVANRFHIVYCSIVREFGETPLDRETYWNFKRARGREVELCKFLHNRIDPAHYIEQFVAKIESPIHLPQDRLVHGAMEVLSSLAERHRLVLVTLRRKGAPLAWQLRELGLTPLLDDILQREDNDGSWMNKSEMIRAHGNGGRRGACMLVGDTEADIQAARLLGIHDVVVANGLRSREVLESFSPSRTIETIRNIHECLPAAAAGMA